MIKGVVRNLDPLGRITLPKEYRKSLGMYLEDKVDMYLDNGIVCVKSYREGESPKGIVRKIDKIGRVSLPKEYRRTLRIEETEPVDIYLNGQVICVKAVKLQCVFCGTDKEERLIEKNGVHICLDCIDELVEEVAR